MDGKGKHLNVSSPGVVHLEPLRLHHSYVRGDPIAKLDLDDVTHCEVLGLEVDLHALPDADVLIQI